MSKYASDKEAVVEYCQDHTAVFNKAQNELRLFRYYLKRPLVGDAFLIRCVLNWKATKILVAPG